MSVSIGQYFVFLWSLIAICLSLTAAQNKEYWCTNKNINPGPELPKIPDAYTIKAEVNYETKKYVADLIRSVDIQRRRESIELWAGNRHVRYISLAEEDTFVNIVYVKNGPTCTTSVLTRTDKREVFTEESAGPLKILQILIEEILPKKERFTTTSESSDIRGMSAGAWEICEYVSSLDKVIKVTLYYTDPVWTLAHQNTTEPTQALMRMKVEGHKEGSKEDGLFLVFDIFSYETGTTSDKYFQVPEDVHCPDFRKNRAPMIPYYFSYQSEKLIERTKGSFVVVHSKVYYDFFSKLMRVDSQDTLSKTSNSDLTQSQTVIMDFKAGVKFTINGEVGSCETGPIQSSMNFIGDLNNVKEMQKPDEFFLMQSQNFSYIGEYETRGMPTNVYSGVVASTGAKNSQYFWYFTPDRTKLIENEVEKNVLVKVVSRPEPLMERKNKTVINIYSFNKERPNPIVFDLSACYNESQSKTYVITFPGNQNALLEKNTFVLQYRMHQVLGTKGGVSLQRISMQKITFGDNYFFVQFKILDSSKHGGAKGENDLGKAESEIRNAVSGKKLTVTLRTKQQMVRLTAEPDGFKEFKEDSKEVTFNEKSVAGLSIGMTVLGFLLGAVVVNLIFTKKYGVSLFQTTSSGSDARTFDNPLDESEVL